MPRVRVNRRELCAEDEIQAFHLINRGVHRTYLCGKDRRSRKDYSHRKEWIRSRLEELAGIFGIDVLGFAVLTACMAYVDLNPIRAGIAETPETRDFTSVQERIADRATAAELCTADAQDVRIEHGHQAGWLAPIALEPPRKKVREKTTGRRASNKGCLSMTLDEYLRHLPGVGSLFLRGLDRYSPDKPGDSCGEWRKKTPDPLQVLRVHCMPPDFDRIARRVIDLADRPLPKRIDVLQKRCPGILSQIRRDSGRTGPLPFWGRCVNNDEYTGTTIVSPAILEVLTATAQRKVSSSTPHSGLQHTYGYLFSVIPTPFGMKRDRWMDDELERCLGLPSQTLGPEPTQGTLLTNVTWLAGSIAFRNDDRMHQLRRRLTNMMAPSLHNMVLPTPWMRLRESFVVPARGGEGVTILLRTDIVRMPRAEGERAANPYLLVYSVADSRFRHPALITLFTVSAEFCEALAKRATQRKRSDIRPRYNAFVPGLSTDLHEGVCQLKRRVQN